jgi:hypothetical protein
MSYVLYRNAECRCVTAADFAIIVNYERKIIIKTTLGSKDVKSSDDPTTNDDGQTDAKTDAKTDASVRR